LRQNNRLTEIILSKKMSGLEIEELLQKTIGLKVTSIGKPILDRAVRNRMKALSLTDKDTYVDKLKSSSFELHDLIEEVVIPETWFFRDREPFRAMTQYLVNQWLPKYNNSLLKVLSVPCSTGEEPYSIAMSLLSSCWPSEKFTVHAVDISHRSVARAKQGIYAEHSFRGSDLAFRSQYFQKKPKHYVLKTSIREKVLFHTGNILNEAFMKGFGVFNVIFSRNVLIYFDLDARKKALNTLYEILHDDGILFVGHAEANLLSNFPFIPAPFPQAFAFFKKPKQELIAEQRKQEFAGIVPAKNKTSFTKQIYPSHKETKKKLPDLGLARKLANKGELKTAKIICQESLDQCGPSAQAFFLLGLIHDAANDVVQAEKLFRQALYLDPLHEEALVFLALLTEKAGDITEARTLKKRLERLQEKKIPSQQNNQLHTDDL